LPVPVATKALFGAMDQLATSWVLGKRGYRLVESADALADLFLRGASGNGARR
jgi:YsiA-like protein, C-terminal region